MGKQLIIAEKPSVAREIAAALGGFARKDGWLESETAIISSGIGHLVEIYAPEAEKGGRDLASLPVIPPEFKTRVIEKTKAQFNLLKKLLHRKDVDLVVNACDAGREGELIFRLIYEHAGCTKPTARMWIQSMTRDAIREAYRALRPGVDFDALGDAARCRSEADWLVGINASRAITYLRASERHAYETMAVGRVQTPTLAMLVHREREIQSFVPKDYWEVYATFRARAGTYVGKWYKAQSSAAGGEDEEAAGSRIWDKAQADTLAAKCRGVNPSSVKDDAKVQHSAPPRLFDLTTLQREANKRFRFSAQKTLGIAQSLYEQHKATTYPRTDAQVLPEDYVGKVKDVLGSFAATAYAEYARRVLVNDWVSAKNRRVFDNAKVSDHFAIIPTGVQPTGLSSDEAKIYDMIVRRFIAAFYPPAEYKLTTRTTVVAGETFRSSGKVLVSSGWLEVYGQHVEDDKTPVLCEVAPGEAVKTERVELKALQTRPPARFTEDTLLAAMESAGKLVEDEALRDALKERGLGTPATRAAIIEGLLSTKSANGRAKTPYAVRSGKAQHLVPTEKGVELIQFLEAVGLDFLTSPKMTGEWEHKIRQIEAGRYRRTDFMDEIAAMTHTIIDTIRKKAEEAPSQERILSAPCPKCGGEVASRPRLFECKAGCGFRLWREIASRALTDEEAAQLLRDGKIDCLEGFVSKAGKKFAAGLKLNADYKAEFVFERASRSGPALPVPCPKCGGVVRAYAGKHPLYACDNGDFKLWRTIAGRMLSDAEAETLIREGALPPMSGFVSRSKKSFSAGLRLSPDKDRVEFVFDD